MRRGRGERGPGGRLRDRDRLAIALRIGDGKSLREIAGELGVHPSTVSREVARNGGRASCDPTAAAARPPEADDRAVPGHWEGDLVLSGDDRAAIVTLVERRSRLPMASLLRSHESEGAVDRLREMVAGPPEGLARTLTWDQGTKMSLHLGLEEASSIRVCFCDPRSPWQRGANENANGLIREHIPEGTDFAEIDEERVQWVVGLPDTRPRKTLGWRTPAEAFAEELESLGVA